MSFIKLCLIFYPSVYPMVYVIVLMLRKNKLLIDPIFETKRRPALRGLLYARDDKLRPTVYITKVGNKRYWHPNVTSCKRKLVACHLYADKIKTYNENHAKIRKSCIPLRGPFYEKRCDFHLRGIQFLRGVIIVLYCKKTFIHFIKHTLLFLKF